MEHCLNKEKTNTLSYCIHVLLVFFLADVLIQMELWVGRMSMQVLRWTDWQLMNTTVSCFRDQTFNLLHYSCCQTRWVDQPSHSPGNLYLSLLLDYSAIKSMLYGCYRMHEEVLFCNRQKARYLSVIRALEQINKPTQLNLCTAIIIIFTVPFLNKTSFQ